MDIGRQNDLQALDRMLGKERDFKKRVKIKQIMNHIINEGSLKRSMREALIRASRNGDVDEIKDIHDFIQGDDRYNNEQIPL